MGGLISLRLGVVRIANSIRHVSINLKIKDGKKSNEATACKLNLNKKINDHFNLVSQSKYQEMEKALTSSPSSQIEDQLTKEVDLEVKKVRPIDATTPARLATDAPAIILINSDECPICPSAWSKLSEPSIIGKSQNIYKNIS